MTDSSYAIGTPWGDREKQAWRAAQRVHRSYEDEVLRHLGDLADPFQVQRYGKLTYAEGTYPLFGVVTREWRPERPIVLLTGGVHGYETSGVQGAIRFLQHRAQDYLDHFNIAAAPCVSPWGYETINRWNPDTLDPNRSFVEATACAEAAQLMAWVKSLPGTVVAHFDLHETTDTDNSEFRPALAARDGRVLDHWDIPDGFYLVSDARAPAPEFQRAIIEAVQGVTHIAPVDSSGLIIGTVPSQAGVIEYDVDGLGLCMGITDAPYRSTTEVYLDSPHVDAESCILAQVTAICGGLDYILTVRSGAG